MTDDDIDWLCGLTEAAEAWEPASSVGPGNFIMPASGARSSKRRRGGNGSVIARSQESPNLNGALPQPTPTDGTGLGRKRKPVTSSLPSRRSPRLQLEQSAPVSTGNARPESGEQSDHATGQPPPPSQLAASQQPYRIQLSRAKRKLHGGSREGGALYFLQIVTGMKKFNLVARRALNRHWEVWGRRALL